ncbi:MAG: hypothetical protein SYNGOMJ08_00531 [Candidatus Syntrophoarchaeum sp. GoM_oil]|nr:MAG: hypothetical protein SYNGOMJ08_00531 [Candidatus Syntrophoarchaeum sp. GoM_oil]
MGFSVSMTFAIFLVAFIALSSILVSSYDYRSNLIEDAKEVRQERMLDELQTDFEITGTSYNAVGSFLTVNVNNTGSTVLNASKVDVILNGSLKTGDISSLMVDGVATTIWAPDEMLRINITGVSSNPARVKLIAENGIADYYET